MSAQATPSESTICAVLPDGSERSLPGGSTGADLARDISEGLARAAVAIEVDGVLRDLHLALPERSSVNIVTPSSPEGLEVLRHSSAHVLAQAVTRLFPDARPTIGPVGEEGVYYDFHVEKPFTPDDLKEIEAEVKKIVKEKIPLRRKEVNRTEACSLFKDNAFKV